MQLYQHGQLGMDAKTDPYGASTEAWSYEAVIFLFLFTQAYPTLPRMLGWRWFRLRGGRGIIHIALGAIQIDNPTGDEWKLTSYVPVGQYK